MKLRNEIPKDLTWDFTPMFADREAWSNACDEADKAIDLIPTLQGTLGQSAAALKNGEMVFRAAA